MRNIWLQSKDRKVLTETEMICDQKLGKCSNNDGKMLKGHRKGHIKKNFNTKINNDNNKIQPIKLS